MFMLTSYSKGKVLERLSLLTFWDDMLHSVALRTIKFMDFYGMRGFESSEYIGANYDNYYMEKQISMFSPDFQITCNLACDAFSTYGNRRFGLYVSERVPVREANGLVNIGDMTCLCTRCAIGGNYGLSNSVDYIWNSCPNGCSFNLWAWLHKTGKLAADYV